jgi:hypothetical protein
VCVTPNAIPRNTERMQPPEAFNVITGYNVIRDHSCAQRLRQLRARHFVGRISLNVTGVVQYQDARLADGWIRCSCQSRIRLQLNQKLQCFGRQSGVNRVSTGSTSYHGRFVESAVNRANNLRPVVF